MEISGIHHVAIIASDYKISKNFYANILGFREIVEVFRKERQSYKCDLEVAGKYAIELFSFPNPPKRTTNPEAVGLRHLCFEVPNIEKAIVYLKSKGITVEEVRIDPVTGKKYTFFSDPDNLPLELKET